MSQRPAGRPSGPPPGGAPPSGAGKTSGTQDSSNSDKVYDKMDVNKDGAVSWKEKQDYVQQHPDSGNAGSTTKIDSDRGVLNALA